MDLFPILEGSLPETDTDFRILKFTDNEKDNVIPRCNIQFVLFIIALQFIYFLVYHWFQCHIGWIYFRHLILRNGLRLLLVIYKLHQVDGNNVMSAGSSRG